MVTWLLVIIHRYVVIFNDYPPRKILLISFVLSVKMNGFIMDVLVSVSHQRVNGFVPIVH